MFDNAERLRKLPGNILAAILRLSELIGLPMCSILISSTIWEKFRGGTGHSEPYLLQFPKCYVARATEQNTIKWKRRNHRYPDPTAFESVRVSQLLQQLPLSICKFCEQVWDIRDLARVVFTEYRTHLPTAETFFG